MRGRTRTTRTAGALTLLAALLLMLAPPAAAQAQGPAGTMVLDITIDAGVTEIRPGPLTVPNPQGPNPFYEVLLRSDPVLDLTPLEVEDEPSGLYVSAADQRPVRLIGWAPGIGYRTWAPLEYVGQVVGANTGLPIQLQGCACAVPPATSPPGQLTLPLTLPAPAASAAGVKPTPRTPAEEAAPEPVGSEAELPGAEAYNMPLEPGRDVALGEASAAAAPLAGDGAGTLAAVVAVGAALLLAKLLVPLYHRFKRKTALDNGTRARLYERLRAAPGASAAELSEASGLHVTTVKYHLDVLRRVGMVGEQSVDGCRRFFSYENGDRMEFLTRALLDEPAAKAVYHQIEQHPGLPFIEVARALGMRKEHVHYHVKKLAKHGLITDRWEGGRRLLFAAQPAAPSHVANPAPPMAAPPLPAPAPPTPMSPEVRA